MVQGEGRALCAAAPGGDKLWVFKNRKKLVWLEHGKGRGEQDNMGLENHQGSDHMRTVGPGKGQTVLQAQQKALEEE